jgi:hypothetical protein
MKSIISSERRNMDLLTLQIVPIAEEPSMPIIIIDENLDPVITEVETTEV